MLKIGDEVTVNWLKVIADQIWESEVISKDWKYQILIPQASKTIKIIATTTTAIATTTIIATTAVIKMIATISTTIKTITTTKATTTIIIIKATTTTRVALITTAVRKITAKSTTINVNQLYCYSLDFFHC